MAGQTDCLISPIYNFFVSPMKALFETPNAETDAVIHILPFQITEYSGKADIDTYFVVCKGIFS